MRQYVYMNFNVKRLLESGDLDIRGVAEQNEEITAVDYFSKVEQFLLKSANMKKTLLGVSKLEEDIKALKELEAKLGVTERAVNLADDTKKLDDFADMKNTLTEIGYDKLNFDIDSICNAVVSGNTTLAQKLANGAYTRFNTLYERVKSAYATKKFQNDKTPSDDATLLSEVLSCMDYDEENRKLRVLAVDDVSLVLNSITSVLSPYYDVYALKNSSQVEAFLAHTTPELFLLDIEMSGLNGFDLVPLIRGFEKHKDTPIIFLTGNASFDNVKGAIALGACDFITKPVDRDVLLDKIERNIVRKKAY